MSDFALGFGVASFIVFMTGAVLFAYTGEFAMVGTGLVMTIVFLLSPVRDDTSADDRTPQGETLQSFVDIEI